ncbi:MAG: (2Fe-2S)-binding protein [Paracoccaceae bacterium]|jgi:aerobic-type carbon monoxide dehydrogenase small subunit (CoxS/CutS family)
MKNQENIELVVNGESLTRTVDHRRNLVDFIRYDLELTGTHVGCEHGVCGACTILVDGKPVRGCLMFAVQANGCEITTLEGIPTTGKAQKLREAFAKRNALQCGFCTPGMITSALDYVQNDGDPSEDKIRKHLSGNYCRCTGYQSIIEAIQDVISEGA